MYQLLQEVVVDGIGRCTVHAQTYEQDPRYMVKDRRGNVYREIAAKRIRPLQKQTIAVNTSMSAQIIEVDA